MTWQVERVGSNVARIAFDATATSWEAWGLLRSDAHLDNVKNVYAFEQEHLELAAQRNAFIIDAGDLFCAMQGKYDPRKDYDQLKPELTGKNYLDLLVKYAANRYKPFVGNFAVLGHGNHEYSILDRLNTDLTERLVERMRFVAEQEGQPCQAIKGGFGGWVLLHFKTTQTQQHIRRLKYFHGAGGAAPVTRGVIQTNRQAVFLPDADYILTGHTHDQWVVPIRRERINSRGSVYLDVQYHVRAGTYKEDYQRGEGEWHVTTGKPPKIVGACWVRFWFDGKNIRQEFIPAPLDKLYV